jgi:hypothetical protein
MATKFKVKKVKATSSPLEKLPGTQPSSPSAANKAAMINGNHGTSNEKMAMNSTGVTPGGKC